MNKINQFLKRDTIQRRSYVILLICWIVIALDADLRAYITSYADYLPLIFITPVILLVLQILFNNRMIWIIILACTVLYTVWTFIKMYMYIMVDHHREYSRIELGLVVFILIMFNWFIFKIKPEKSDTTIT